MKTPADIACISPPPDISGKLQNAKYNHPSFGHSTERFVYQRLRVHLRSKHHIALGQELPLSLLKWANESDDKYCGTDFWIFDRRFDFTTQDISEKDHTTIVGELPLNPSPRVNIRGVIGIRATNGYLSRIDQTFPEPVIVLSLHPEQTISPSEQKLASAEALINNFDEITYIALHALLDGIDQKKQPPLRIQPISRQPRLATSLDCQALQKIANNHPGEWESAEVLPPLNPPIRAIGNQALRATAGQTLLVSIDTGEAIVVADPQKFRGHASRHQDSKAADIFNRENFPKISRQMASALAAAS